MRSDNELYKLILEHNEEAFIAVFDRYGAELYLSIKQVAAIRPQSEQQLQEDSKQILISVFHLLWDEKFALPDGVSLSEYLFSTAHELSTHYTAGKLRQKYKL